MDTAKPPIRPVVPAAQVVAAFPVAAGSNEGREGVKWELGFAFFRGWKMGFCAPGLEFMKKKTIKNGNGISI